MEYLLLLQNLRNASASVFNSFMMEVTELGQAVITYLLLAYVYWCVNKRSGQLMAFNVSFACWLNQWTKKIFKVDRPWVKDTRIVPVEAAVPGATGYSMPSRHTTRTVATWGTIGFTSWKNRKGSDKNTAKQYGWLSDMLWLVVLLVMFSRNYLGVHTFEDVMVALVAGVVLIFALDKLLDWVDATTKGYRDIIVCVVGCIIICLPMIKFGCLSNAGSSFGFLIGWLLERRLVGFKTEGTWLQKAVRFFPGALIVYFCYTSGTTVVSHVIDTKYAGFCLNLLAALFIMFIYPLVFDIWEREEKKKYKRIVVIVLVVLVLIIVGVVVAKTASHYDEFAMAEIVDMIK